MSMFINEYDNDNKTHGERNRRRRRRKTTHKYTKHSAQDKNKNKLRGNHTVYTSSYTVWLRIVCSFVFGSLYFDSVSNNVRRWVYKCTDGILIMRGGEDIFPYAIPFVRTAILPQLCQVPSLNYVQSKSSENKATWCFVYCENRCLYVYI